MVTPAAMSTASAVQAVVRMDGVVRHARDVSMLVTWHSLAVMTYFSRYLSPADKLKCVFKMLSGS